MRKYVNAAFYYAIAAMCGGVFYREFTKFNQFAGRTTLAFVHVHLFVLGMVMMLLAGILCGKFKLEKNKNFKRFFMVYNIGLPMTVVMLTVRGVFQVMGTELSKGASASISGIAGIAHIVLGVGIVLFFIALRQEIKE